MDHATVLTIFVMELVQMLEELAILYNIEVRLIACSEHSQFWS